LTVVFAGLGGYCLARCTLPAARRFPHAPTGWVNDALGVAMSATMIAMLWAVPLDDRWGVRLALFGTAGGWYLVRASRPGIGPGARAGLVHHGVAMAAMLWMLAAAPDGTAAMAHEAMAATAPAGSARGPAGAISTLLATYLALAALWWVGSAVRATPRPTLAAAPPNVVALPSAEVVFGAPGAAICQAVMASAMCVALLVR
jgi:hypothetical protein